MLLNFLKVAKTIFILILMLVLEPNSALAKSIPNIWNVPKANDFFVGRTQELDELRKLIDKNHKAVITGTDGIGKTQLVKKFVHDNYENYQIILWFDMLISINAQLSLFAHQLDKAGIGSSIDIDRASEEVILLYIKDTLRKTDKSWLIIFDNAKNTDLIKDYIPESHNKPKQDIIITSRNSNQVLPTLYLNKFSEADSLQFLSKSTVAKNVREENTDTQDKDNLSKLSKLLDCYPLALAQASAYIKINNMKVDEYISIFTKDPHNIWKNEKLLLESAHDYFDLNKKTIETTLNLNLQNLKNESEEGFEIIEIISLIKRSQIPEYLLLDFIRENKDKYKDTDKDVYANTEEFQTAIRALKNHSLIEEYEINGKTYYRAHDLVKQVTKKYLQNYKGSRDKKEDKDSNPLTEIYHKLFKVMISYLDKPWGEMIGYINENTELVEIATSIAFSAYDDKIQDPLLAQLTICLLEHNNMVFHNKSNYLAYQGLAEKLYALLEEKEFKLPLTLESRYYFNAIYSNFILLTEESINKFEQQLQSLLKLLEARSDLQELYFLALINTGEFCFLKGDINQGVTYIEKAYPLLKTIENTNYQAQFWYAATWLYIEQGNYHKANEYIKTFFEITKTDKNYPIHLYAMNLRASVNLHLNNLKESFFWADKCYRESIKFFKSDISDVSAQSLITLARYYKSNQTNQNYNIASNKIRRAIEILDIVFDSPVIDPTQAIAHTVLGEIYAKHENYKKAYDEYQFAEKYYMRSHKHSFSNMKEISNLFADIAILGIKIHDKLMTKRYFTKLVDIFSYQNPNTKKVIAELDKHQIYLND